MFPFSENIEIRDDQEKSFSVSYEKILLHVQPLLTKERWSRIEKVVAKRCFSNAVVLENIYDRGNASAVMRSAEALGFSQVHMIELGEKFKESQRTTAGADKWIELKKWKSTAECVKAPKDEGKQIVVTHLDDTSKPISAVDFSKPTALVLGNEKDGISAEMARLADHRVLLPMVGFVQSYNISVAAALSLYHMYCDRVKKLGHQGDLTDDQKEILKAVYCLRTLDSSKDILKRLL